MLFHSGISEVRFHLKVPKWDEIGIMVHSSFKSAVSYLHR
jgi:hypothetical protein